MRVHRPFATWMAVLGLVMLMAGCDVRPEPPRNTVDDLLSRMSLDDKVGQMIQAERAAVTPDEVREYRLGSVLSGGGSAPPDNSPAGWADVIDAYQRGALQTTMKIPISYGIDAVHGDNNVYGSTIFPHPIGLGASRDPDLVERIGTATAKEVSGELGFAGIVVSDRAAIDRLDGRPGITEDEVVTAVTAGQDMPMVPQDWRSFLGYLRDAVRTGRIPMSRIDDAVRRVLTKKVELGLFEHPFADRAYAGTIGSAAHRDLARQAVRESQVLLKNDDEVLPLAKTGGKVFVAGKNADDIGNQSGGWTPTWQGASGDTVPGTTILQGIRDVAGQGTTITYDRDGAGVDGTYRAAIAVLGETPYAEGQGDRPGGLPLDADDRRVLAKLKTAGVPVVVVLVSGRPLDIAGQVDDWPALVEAWLPGSEGAGVADVLFGDYAPTGRLPVTWPRSSGQQPINAGDGKAGLYAYGYGLGYPDRPADGAAPSRPGTPVATAGKLRWTAATDEAGGGGIDGYDVLRDGALFGATTSAEYPLGALTPGVHDFTVVARDKAGNRSAPSTPLEITVPVPGGCKTRHGPCVAT